MNKLFAAALIGFAAVPAVAQNHAGHGAAAPATAARFTLDTPIEQIVADPAGKAALDTAVPGISTHPAFDQFKSMSLRQVQPFSNGALTDETMAKAEAALAAVK
ncbi:hypothetical protein GVO57_08405 [Sphingomonas changnyeongensis]|uniref:Uncharacterized protein n=1 Tax=Sphingomonas changnyeongensis TaxID=2698679 RepID=A0A7Z2S8N8_9SPHN|nr:hypothetical protein [Sphingomonas changnyeongensis]QHL90837.1 hypothetical protein GVO57_08405 [Sphingomonas changnyeongensis]